MAAGGVAGVFARYFVVSIAALFLGARLPWGTFAVNLTGCFLVGLLDALTSRKGFAGPHARMLLISGFCGAYTTFSALIFEFDALLRVSPLRAGAYLLITVAAGLSLFRAGLAVGGG